MFPPPQYAAPPPGYMHFDYRTPPVSPNGGNYGYPSPRYSVHTATPSPRGSPKHHARRASQDPRGSYTYTSPRMPEYYAAYSSPRYYTSQQSTPQRNTDYVSNSERTRSKAAPRFRASRDSGGKHSYYHHCDDPKRRKQSSRSQYIYNVVVDDGDYYQYYDAPPPYETYQSHRQADHYPFYDQVPIYTEAEPTPAAYRSTTTRARRASHSTRPQPPPPKPRPSTSAKSPRKATEEDARRAGIPAGFSYKNWDPTEEPITLLGSVFDANSLGKWIYDWTVFHHGPATPLSEVAGDLWLLLIQLAGKVKRADEAMPRIRREASRELVEDFLESGERLWIRVQKLLKSCEEYMWKAARREAGDKKPVTMGKNSGCEFVDSIFGRDRELERTEKLMTAIRLWGMRFDANCDEILRNTYA